MNREELKDLESVITDCLDVLHTCMNRFKYVETQVQKLLQGATEPKTEFTFTAHGIANEPQKQAKIEVKSAMDPVTALISKMSPEEKAQFKQKLIEASNPQGAK